MSYAGAPRRTAEFGLPISRVEALLPCLELLSNQPEDQNLFNEISASSQSLVADLTGLVPTQTASARPSLGYGRADDRFNNQTTSISDNLRKSRIVVNHPTLESSSRAGTEPAVTSESSTTNTGSKLVCPYLFIATENHKRCGIEGKYPRDIM